MRLSDIKTVTQFMEYIDWELDGAGLVVTDGHELAKSIYATVDDIEWDCSFPYVEDVDETL